MQVRFVQNVAIVVAMAPSIAALIIEGETFGAAKILASVGLILIAALLVPARSAIRKLGGAYDKYGFPINSVDSLNPPTSFENWWQVFAVGGLSFGGGLVVWASAILVVGRIV